MAAPTTLLTSPLQNETYDALIQYSYGDSFALAQMAIEEGLFEAGDADYICCMPFAELAADVARAIARKVA